MRRYRWIIWYATLIVIAVTLWNFPLTYNVGIDGMVLKKKIPLYAKVSGFLYRDWTYKEIVGEIVKGKERDLDKALAILKWVSENISGEIPKGQKIFDDHPLNIIIRRYGARDQIEDIFTILCEYAGMKAARKKCYNQERTHYLILSFVRAGNRWLIFHASANKYFRNGDGAIASLEDYLSGNLILAEEEVARYGEYIDGLKDIEPSALERNTRAEEQMPFKRPLIQLKKALGGGAKVSYEFSE